MGISCARNLPPYVISYDRRAMEHRYTTITLGCQRHVHTVLRVKAKESASFCESQFKELHTLLFVALPVCLIQRCDLCKSGRFQGVVTYTKVLIQRKYSSIAFLAYLTCSDRGHCIETVSSLLLCAC